MAQLPIRNLRLRAFESAKLDQTAGQLGDVYYDQTAGTLRLYTGRIQQGIELSRADLANVSKTDFVSLATTARLFGPNIHIHNTAVNSNNLVTGDKDYVSFTTGTTPITAFYLTKYVGIDLKAFFAIQQGTAWTAGQDVNQMLTYGHLGSGGALPVGINILAGNPLHPGAVTLAANTTYTMWIQQTGSNITEYALSTNPYWVPATADLPANYSGDPATPTVLYQQGGGGAGSGDVVGPASATDNAIARFNLATGKLIQNSLVTISDSGAITAPLASSVIPFHYDSQADFPSATTYHGAIAHSHADGKMYFAHSGAWSALANASELVSLGNLSFGTGTITTTDSSGITVTPQTQFRSNILVDGDVGLTGNGSKRVGESVGGWIEFNQDITVDPATNRDFVVDTYNGATHYRWAFDSGGEFIFPDGTIQATAYTGNVGSINLLADVDTVSTPPTVGQVLKWNGTNWVPAADATVGGAGTDADTLDGLDSSYFLNFVNISNKPNIFNTIAVAGQSSVVADSATDTLTLVAGTGLSITTNAGTDTITLTNTVTDTNTTYAISAETVGGGVNLRLTGSDASTDNVTFAQGSNITLTRTDASTITVASSFTDTNTTYAISAETNASGADIRLTGSDAATDNLTIAAGANVTVTRTDANTITIASTATGGGGGTVTDVSVVSTNGFAGTVAGSTTTPAITLTTTLTGVLKGNGTSLAVATAGTDYQAPLPSQSGNSGRYLTTDGSGTLSWGVVAAGATTFTTLTDVPVGLTIDKIYLPAITMLTVGVDGSVAYTFDQYSGNNPTIYAISGTTIAFNLAWTIGNHPFLIRSGGVNYTTGLVHVSTAGVVSTGGGALGKNNGTLYWKIPASASGTFQYVCSNHIDAGMYGDITVKAFSTL
jgi:plastocyanin/ribulose-5-phosphate 4-epimerase/fuculose-1-phosphate aldolase